MVLHLGAKQRLKEAFRPKTQKCYEMLFRIFVVFGLCIKFSISSFGTNDALSYLEYLVRNNVPSNMLANHVSAVRAHFVSRGLNFSVWDHPNIKYFQKVG